MKSVKTFAVAVLMAVGIGMGQALACDGAAKAQNTASTPQVERQAEQKVCPFSGKSVQQPTQPAQNTGVQFVTVSNQTEAVSAKQCTQTCHATSVTVALALGLALVGGVVVGVGKLKL
ncbi:MAG: hypothetical protein RMM53_11715 [Bacteroidia bacterium]|nr:hypothetical protein [Bacteroidia bacterium]MDW8334874.1 hypothetical protein [Bacteroidia bacterium]